MNRFVHHLPKPSQRQQGMALFVVLILLLVLSLSVVALTRNQTGATRQIADRLDSLNLHFQSAQIHDACVANLRSGLADGHVTIALYGDEGTAALPALNDIRWSESGRTCLYEWFQLPAIGSADNHWTPAVRITSRVTAGADGLLEISEWRYPLCLNGESCFSGKTAINVRSASNLVRVVYAQFRTNAVVRTARMQIP